MPHFRLVNISESTVVPRPEEPFSVRFAMAEAPVPGGRNALSIKEEDALREQGIFH
jgi:hypothetical protein